MCSLQNRFSVLDAVRNFSVLLRKASDLTTTGSAMKLLFGLLGLCLIGVRSEWYGPYDYPFGSSEVETVREPRLLNLFGKGWKSGHPLTEFGKIHIIKKGWGQQQKHHEPQHQGYGYGWGTYGDSHEEHGDSHGHGHGHGGGGHGGGGHGWGWGGHPVQQVHVTGWKEPEKKGWFTFPKKSFGIHVKGGVGFSFGGKKGAHKQTTVHHVSPGWGQHQQYGWGWNGWNGWQPQRHHEGGHHERTLPLNDQTNKISSGGRSLEIENDYEIEEPEQEESPSPSFRLDEEVFGTGDLGPEIIDYVYAPGYNYFNDY